MYIIDDKVYLHLQKCGGVSVRENLRDNRAADFRFGEIHLNINLIPEKYKNYKRYAFVRNPCAWYLSDYYYNVQRHKQGRNVNPLIHVLMIDNNNEIIPLETFVKNATDMETYFTDEKYRILKRLINRDIGKMTGKWLRSTINDTAELKKGFFKDRNTLYQFLIKAAGIDTAQTFKMEDKEDRNKLYNIFEITDNYKKNVTLQKGEMASASKKIIQEKDNYVFELFGYNKEINDGN